MNGCDDLDDRHPMPDEKEIEETLTELKARTYARVINFSDMTNRYFEIILRNKVNWLRLSALNFIIARGGSLTASQLARRMLRSNHSMTRLIDSLEADGLVVRERDDADRRAVYVKVTKAGVRYVKQILQDFDFIDDEIFSCLDQQEKENLKIIIIKLRARLMEKTRKIMKAGMIP